MPEGKMIRSVARDVTKSGLCFQSGCVLADVSGAVSICRTSYRRVNREVHTIEWRGRKVVNGLGCVMVGWVWGAVGKGIHTTRCQWNSCVAAACALGSAGPYGRDPYVSCACDPLRAPRHACAWPRRDVPHATDRLIAQLGERDLCLQGNLCSCLRDDRRRALRLLSAATARCRRVDQAARQGRSQRPQTNARRTPAATDFPAVAVGFSAAAIDLPTSPVCSPAFPVQQTAHQAPFPPQLLCPPKAPDALQMASAFNLLQDDTHKSWRLMKRCGHGWK